MIIIDINGVNRQLPSGWFDMDYATFLKVAESDHHDRPYKLIDVDESECNDVQKEFIELTFDWCRDINQAFNYAINYTNDQFNISEVEWGDFEKCKQLLSKQDIIHIQFGKIIEILLGINCDKLSMPEVFGMGYS